MTSKLKDILVESRLGHKRSRTNWRSGKILLCTQAGKSEISNHKKRADRGLEATGFAAVTVGGRRSTTVHLKEPTP